MRGKIDRPRNEDGIGEKELLVVSVGTIRNDGRAAAIGAIEDALEQAFPDYAVRRGFTSKIILERIRRRDGEVIDDVEAALDRAGKNGVKELLVQPALLMSGREYGGLAEELKKRADGFETIRLGAPLLTTDEDFAIVARAVVRAVPAGEKTAVCYVGHGTSAGANAIYGRMQRVLADAGHDNYFIGTVKSQPTAGELARAVKAGGYEKAILRPMMIVAGGHASKDMADPDDPASWDAVFTAAGLAVTCELKGLGELEEVRQLLAAHAREARRLGQTE